MSSFFILSQIFAFCVVVCDIITFQVKERKSIIILLCLWAFFNILHYSFLLRYVGAAIITLSLVRFITSYFTTRREFIFLFIVLQAVVTYVFFKDAYDLVIFIWSIFITISVFQKNDKYLRMVMMGAIPWFILYDILVWSPVWIIMDTIFFTSNLVWYFRHYPFTNTIWK